MEEAYNKASGDGKLYAKARQIMYAARPQIIEMTGKPLKDVYFTQTLLKDYLEEYNPDWKVVWDARGHITEPHTGKMIGLGGIEVRQYKNSWRKSFNVFESQSSYQSIDTVGPTNRFNSVLFIEKEGFREILEYAGIARKYDVAIMSTKGLPVGAACELANEFHKLGVTIYVMHNFDLAGFKIVKTLREGVRLHSGVPVTDFGFRVDDIDGLESESTEYNQEADPKDYLEKCGATEEEQDFLVDEQDIYSKKKWFGKRVELNAMTSPQLVEWIETKFEEHSVSKFIPDKKVLKDAYKRAIYLKKVDEKREEIEKELKDSEYETPDDLEDLLDEYLKKHEKQSWDYAIWEIAEDESETADSCSDCPYFDYTGEVELCMNPEFPEGKPTPEESIPNWCPRLLALKKKKGEREGENEKDNSEEVESEEDESSVSEEIDVDEQNEVIIIRNCQDCTCSQMGMHDWGLLCDHPYFQGDDPKQIKERGIPDWCPLLRLKK